MAIRIDRISIDRGGPLKDDFILEPAGLNLIYGSNETGKTYIVEALIDFLFKTGKGTPWIQKKNNSPESTFREWKPRGKILVSGLEDTTTVFTSGGFKLEDFRTSDSRFPEDLSRLLVVRAGDTRLSSAGDESVLRTFLSDQTTLNEVENNIRQDAIRTSTIVDGAIESTKKMGRIKDRNHVIEEKLRLEQLQQDVNENASLGKLSSLGREKRLVQEKVEEQEGAKRYEAFRTEESIRKLELEMDDQPADQYMSDLDIVISQYETKKDSLSEEEKKLKDSASLEEDYSWSRIALEEYLSSTEKQKGRKGSGFLCYALIFFFIAATVAVGFFSRPLMLMTAVGAIICLIIHRRKESESLSSEEIIRLRQLKDEFMRRFQQELTDSAILQVVSRKLEKEHILLENHRGNYDKLKSEIDAIEKDILSRFRLITGAFIPEEKWDITIGEIKKRNLELRERIIEQRMILSSLNVLAEDYISTEPAIHWDENVYTGFMKELETISQEMLDEEQHLEILKSRLMMETGITAGDIEELLSALDGKLESIEEDYKSITAEILAKILVHTVVNEYRDSETARLEATLKSPQFVTHLSELTHRYNGMKFSEEGYLNITMADGDEFPLEQLSTGTMEQIYLVLRTGIAELCLQEPAFLIFDDAFQHSDWERRENLVNRVIGLVNNGWQVFYFTMDDHLKKLFDKSGKDIGQAGYRSIRLN
ncbi:hypothetical protein DRQ25_06010 [Candidatus Fermentibacteria bacterium]|nr:MAG: hypothetical protein DRQ25_06010 [Candidatus Fermentibacteria bacterium]